MVVHSFQLLHFLCFLYHPLLSHHFFFFHVISFVVVRELSYNYTSFYSWKVSVYFFCYKWHIWMKKF